MIGLDVAAALARAITDKTVREQPQSQFVPATIVNFARDDTASVSYADVHISGDPPEEIRQVSVISGTVLNSGDPVMVYYDPPEGAYVWAGPNQCTCVCDCATGDWTITPTGLTAESAFSTSHIVDVDTEMTTVTVTGTTSHADTAAFRVYKNGVIVATETLPSSGTAWTEEVAVNTSFVIGDEITFEFVAFNTNGSSMLFTGASFPGFVPWSNGAAIGSGNDYMIGLQVEDQAYPAGGTLGTDEELVSGTSGDITVPSGALPFTLSTSWAGVNNIYCYVSSGATPGVVRECYLVEGTVSVTYTGDGSPLYATVQQTPGGTQTATVTGSGGVTFPIAQEIAPPGTYPGAVGDRYLFAVTWGATHPDFAAELTTFTANMTNPRANATVDWIGGG